MIASVPLILFPFCLIAAALNDALHFKIPNALSVVLIGSFGIAAIIVEMPMSDLLVHVATAFIVLAVGFGLFLIKELTGHLILGAGDTKLLTAVALWFGWPGFLTTLITITLVGGLLSVTMVALHFIARSLPSLTVRYRPIAALASTHIRKIMCPYGIAITIGTLLCFDASPLLNDLIAQVL